MFFRKSLFGSWQTRGDESKKSKNRTRNWFGRRRGMAMEALEDRQLLAIYAPGYEGPIEDQSQPFVATGGSWPGNVVTYSYVASGVAAAAGGEAASGPSVNVANFLPANYKEIIRRAFDEW